MMEKIQVKIKQSSACNVKNKASDATIKPSIVPNSNINANIKDYTVIQQTDGQFYDGEYLVAPSTTKDTVLNTQFKYMRNNIVVQQIPFEQVSNNYGTTIIIGG